LYPSTKRILVKVTSESDSVRTYYVDVQRAPSNIADLQSFTPSCGSLVPTFDAGTTAYALDLPNSVSSISMNAAVEDSTATIVWSPSSRTQSSIPVSPDTRVITATVHAQDGTTVKTYGVTIIRARSSNAQVQTLSILSAASSASIFPAFATATYEYEMSAKLGPSISSVMLKALPQDLTASLKYRTNGAHLLRA